MRDEFRYRAVQRAKGSDREWEVLTSKVFESEPAVRAFVEHFKVENRYFGWNRVYAIQRQPYGDWEFMEETSA